MSYFNYHAAAKRLIREGRLKGWYIAEHYNNTSPALVLVCDDIRHPVSNLYYNPYYAALQVTKKKQNM